MKVEPMNRRAIRIVSQCASADEFVAVFRPYLERDALFIATGSPEEAGARLRFVMTLASGEPMMKGGAVVLETHRDRSNFYGLRGMKVRFDELDEGSRRTLAKLESGPPPSRRAASQPGIAGARRVAEVLECLIFEEPGSEAAEPLAGSRALMDSSLIEQDHPPLGADDDVTAVAPPPQRPGEPITQRDLAPADPAAVAALAAASAARPGPGNRFIVPAPKSEPGIVVVTPELPGDGASPPIASDPGEATPRAASAPAPVPQVMERPRDGNGAAAHTAAPATSPAAPAVAIDLVPARPRGKGGGPSGERPALPNPPAPVAVAPIAPAPGSVFELGPTPDAGPDRGSNPPMAQLHTMRMQTSPPPLHPDPPAMPERTRAAVEAIGMATPTEIVSPLALRNRTSKPPLPPERTELVRVGQLRTAAVSATLGALLGLGAGYLLWGLAAERGGTAAPIDATAPGRGGTTPAPAPVMTPDAGPAAATPDAGPPAEALRVQRALRLVSTPPGAEVLIDKKHAGVTPFELPLDGKKAMTVTLRKVGFRPWTKVLQGDEMDTTFEVVLRRAVPPPRRKPR